MNTSKLYGRLWKRVYIQAKSKLRTESDDQVPITPTGRRAQRAQAQNTQSAECKTFRKNTHTTYTQNHNERWPYIIKRLK